MDRAEFEMDDHRAAWAAHLPAGGDPAAIPGELAAGGTLPRAIVDRWAADPAAVVLVEPDGSKVTAAELAERTASAAGRFLAAGCRPGDRVLFSAATGVPMVVAHLGALRAGLTVVPANPAYRPAELARLVSDATPRLGVLDDPDRVPGLPATRPDLSGLPTQSEPSSGLLDRAGPDDIGLVVYTSGTTGRPKGARLSHRNLLAGAQALRLAWRWTADDRLVLALPLFHVHGLAVGLHGTLLVGGSAVLLPGFDPDAVGRAITERGGTMFFGVPTMYHRLAGSPRLADLSGLRLAVSGSGPLPAELHGAVRAGSGQRVLERYGMSETLMLVGNPYDGERRPGTVGLPLPGVELRQGSGPDGTGEQESEEREIEVRGPNVSAGYLGGVGREAFTSDGWFATGDLATVDPDGYVRIRGRVKELIITGGLNVHPREVEEVLAEHPAVEDAAVRGMPSAEWGEVVAAFLVPNDAVTTDELVAWCAERLAPYKRPRIWRLVESIPRNAVGKIQRDALPP